VSQFLVVLKIFRVCLAMQLRLCDCGLGLFSCAIVWLWDCDATWGATGAGFRVLGDLDDLGSNFGRRLELIGARLELDWSLIGMIGARLGIGMIGARLELRLGIGAPTSGMFFKPCQCLVCSCGLLC